MGPHPPPGGKQRRGGAGERRRPEQRHALRPGGACDRLFRDARAGCARQAAVGHRDGVREGAADHQNQYDAGVANPSDVASAQTQLDTARAQLVNVGVLRSQYEHAIAVLTGVAPAELTIEPDALAEAVPVAPGVVPSVLLQRRPDIAAAERTMQEENALIGVQIAAYYPDISLSALYGYSGNPIGSLIQVANRVWSLGANATQTLFEGGLRDAEVAAARAAYDASVANYRQTVLTAFQQVEDELSALRILEQQAAATRDGGAVGATVGADRAQHVSRRNRRIYQRDHAADRAASDQETALSVQEQRLVASVALVQALGGGFDASDCLPRRAAKGLPFLEIVAELYSTAQCVSKMA